MTLWTSTDGKPFIRTPLALFLRPIDFPVFRDQPAELPNQRAQRWRSEFKELANKQHDFVLASACYAFEDHQRTPSALKAVLQGLGDRLTGQRHMDFFSVNIAQEPLEVSVNYRLAGSSKLHSIVVSGLNPSSMEL